MNFFEQMMRENTMNSNKLFTSIQKRYPDMITYNNNNIYTFRIFGPGKIDRDILKILRKKSNNLIHLYILYNRIFNKFTKSKDYCIRSYFLKTMYYLDKYPGIPYNLSLGYFPENIYFSVSCACHLNNNKFEIALFKSDTNNIYYDDELDYENIIQFYLEDGSYENLAFDINQEVKRVFKELILRNY